MKATLKPVLAACVFALSFTPLVQAQDPAPAPAPKTETPPPAAGERAQRGGGRGMMNPEARLAALKEALTLTDEQVEKVKPILAEEQTAMTALRDKADLAPEDRRSEMTKIRSASSAKIVALLTPEQKEKFEKMPPPQRRGGGPGGGGPGGGQGSRKEGAPGADKAP